MRKFSSQLHCKRHTENYEQQKTWHFKLSGTAGLSVFSPACTFHLEDQLVLILFPCPSQCKIKYSRSFWLHSFWKTAFFFLPSRPKEALYACVQVTSIVSDSLWPYGLWPTNLLCPWASPDKNTGVDCHLLQGIFLTQGLNPRLLHFSCTAGRSHNWATGEAMEALAWG